MSVVVCDSIASLTTLAPTASNGLAIHWRDLPIDLLTSYHKQLLTVTSLSAIITLAHSLTYTVYTEPRALLSLHM